MALPLPPLNIKSSSSSELGDVANNFARNRTGGISASLNQGLKTEYVIGAAVIVLVVWLLSRGKK